MGKQKKESSNLPAVFSSATELSVDSVKTETYAGKETARVTKIFEQEDGSILKATRKINKDGSISDKMEHRHK